MHIIRPSTRYKWKHRLTNDYGYDEDTAQTVVDFVATDPDVETTVPSTQQELDEAVIAVDRTLNKIDLDELADSDCDHDTIRAELMAILKSNLSASDMATGSHPSRPVPMALGNKQEQQPPEHLAEYIDKFVAIIESDDDFELEDLEAILDWVRYRIEG